MIYFDGGFWVPDGTNFKDFGSRAIVARRNDILAVSFECRLVLNIKSRTILKVPIHSEEG
jgi:hypothetical protein